MQCLKTVNHFVEPDISLPALRSLVGDSEKPEAFNQDVSYPSISVALANDESFLFRIETPTPLFGSGNNIVAYLVRFKTGGELIFQP